MKGDKETSRDKEPRNPAMLTHRQGYMKGDRKRQRETRSPATRQRSPKNSEQDASEPIGPVSVAPGSMVS